MAKDMAYIALCKCGKMVMFCVDLPGRAKDTAKEVAACIRKGFEIKRVTVEAVRNELEFCMDSKKHMNSEKDKLPLFKDAE